MRRPFLAPVLLVSLLLAAPATAASFTIPTDPALAISALPGDPVGSLLDWLQILVGSVEWHSSGSTVEENAPREDIAGNPPLSGAQDSMLSLNVSSVPAGGLVFVDNRGTGKTTPCTVEVRSGTNSTIGITLDSYMPFEQEVNGPGPIEAVLVPLRDMVKANTTAGPIANQTPEPTTPASHHGGFYIRSYPETVDIRIDNVLMGSRAPVIVNPLKEGTYTITAAIAESRNVYSSRESQKVTVIPGVVIPVTFNLMVNPKPEKVDITSTSRKGTRFTVNGYSPEKKVGDRIELVESPSFITLTGGSSFISFFITEYDRERGQFDIPDSNPPVCNLSILSRPEGGEIFLDGIRTGYRTPAVIPNVSSGYHRIWILSDGMSPVDELIQIPDSLCLEGSFQVSYLLETYPSGDLRVLSDPPGANIAIRGMGTGEVTPYIFEDVPLGIWEVSFTDPGGKVEMIDVTLEPGRTKSCSVVFG